MSSCPFFSKKTGVSCTTYWTWTSLQSNGKSILSKRGIFLVRFGYFVFFLDSYKCQTCEQGFTFRRHLYITGLKIFRLQGILNVCKDYEKSIISKNDNPLLIFCVICKYIMRSCDHGLPLRNRRPRLAFLPLGGFLYGFSTSTRNWDHSGSAERSRP